MEDKRGDGKKKKKKKKKRFGIFGRGREVGGKNQLTHQFFGIFIYKLPQKNNHSPFPIPLAIPLPYPTHLPSQVPTPLTPPNPRIE